MSRADLLVKFYADKLEEYGSMVDRLMETQSPGLVKNQMDEAGEKIAEAVRILREIDL